MTKTVVFQCRRMKEPAKISSMAGCNLETRCRIFL